jgi:hypothetical protein
VKGFDLVGSIVGVVASMVLRLGDDVTQRAAEWVYIVLAVLRNPQGTEGISQNDSSEIVCSDVNPSGEDGVVMTWNCKGA